MLGRLFGRGRGPQRATAEQTGLQPVPLQGGFDVEVVGESNYQDALAAACGGRQKDGVNYDCTAVLRPEPSNPYDANAIRVEINGRLVGYLNRHAAKAYKPVADRLAADGKVGTCQALIVGGWDRGRGDTGHFGVRLDLGVN